MLINIAKIRDHFPEQALCSTWRESLPNLTAQRIPWFYKDCVFGSATLWLAESDGDVIGCCAVVPRFFRIAGCEYPGGYTVDFAVKKKYRILGPAIKLQKTICTQSIEVPFLLGFPNRRGSQILKRVGYRKVGDLVRYVFLFSACPNPHLGAGSLFFHSAKMLSSGGFRSLRLYNQIVWGTGRLVWEEASISDVKVDHIWQQAKANFGFIGSRTSAYLRWRFGRSPYKDYGFAIVRSKCDPEAVGYVVYSAEEDVLLIVDFLWLPEYISLEQLLVGFISHIAHKRPRAVSLTILDTPRMNRTLKRLFFLRRERTGELLFFTSRKKIQDAIEQSLGSAFVTHGDCDF